MDGFERRAQYSPAKTFESIPGQQRPIILLLTGVELFLPFVHRRLRLAQLLQRLEMDFAQGSQLFFGGLVIAQTPQNALDRLLLRGSGQLCGQQAVQVPGIYPPFRSLFASEPA